MGQEHSRVIVIDAGATGLVLAVGDDGRLHQIAFGPHAADRRADLPVPLYPLAYPTFGEEPLREPALRVTHGDGALSTRLRFVSASVVPATDQSSADQSSADQSRADRSSSDQPRADRSSSGQPSSGQPSSGQPAGGAPAGAGVVHRIELEDRVAPLAVTLWFRTWPAIGVLEQWVEVTNRGDRAVTVHDVAATAPALAGEVPHLTHWGGGWAAEWTETAEALRPGVKTVASAGGVRPSLHAPPVVLYTPDGPAAETSGSVATCTVQWGGDVRFDAELTPHGQVRLIAGHQARGAERVLDPGEAFTTPRAAWVWSADGVGPASRALHRFTRDHVVRGGQRTRATVANTWEAVGFRLDPAGLTAQIDRAADLGAELFLLDDGWFGVDHPRDDDTIGLGDWEVDRRKLPDGLQPLVDRTLERGMRFGLWVEPEMVNPRSRLYEEHPDWVIGEQGRERREERNQLVLDLCRPEVRAWVVDAVSAILRAHPGISYLKWDANRDITEPGSAALAADRQSHLPVDRVAATWEVMAELARRHPEVELMACASGGGRSDLGTLRWFHELWTSDNTDPIDRLRIQWGASHLLPALVLGAHVTRWGQHPVAFGCAVAMSGRFGFDLDLTALSAEEARTCTQAAASYREVRDLVQHGDLHRLVSPLGSDRSAVAYADPDGGRAVVLAYRWGDGPGVAVDAATLVALLGLDPGSDPSLVEVVDHTPGRSGGRGAGAVGAAAPLPPGGIPWPDGPAPAATVVELRARA